MLADSIDLTPPLGWTLSDQQTSERLTALLGIRRLRKHPSLSLSKAWEKFLQYQSQRAALMLERVFCLASQHHS